MKRSHWTLGLAVMLAAATGTFLARGGNSDKKGPSPAAEEAQLPVAGAAEASKPVDPPNTGDAAKPALAQAKAADTAKPVDPSNTRNASKPGLAHAKAVDERGRLLETVGCLTAAHYFQTYLNIGFIAEGKAQGTYTDKDARKVLDSVLSLLNSTDEKLEALGKIELDKGDRERLEQLRAASALLRQQGKELQVYWETGKDENAAKYESLRKNAWATISKLMGIGQ